MLVFRAQDDSIKECICGHIFAFEQGSVDLGFKDDQGEKISDNAAIHMSLNRINCPKCKKIFCYKCKAEPYHLGKTCDEALAYKESDKCRFCEDAM